MSSKRVSACEDDTCCSSGAPGHRTTVGCDLRTGLGSPNAQSFVHDLATMFPRRAGRSLWPECCCMKANTKIANNEEMKGKV